MVCYHLSYWTNGDDGDSRVAVDISFRLNRKEHWKVGWAVKTIALLTRQPARARRFESFTFRKTRSTETISAVLTRRRSMYRGAEEHIFVIAIEGGSNLSETAVVSGNESQASRSTSRSSAKAICERRCAWGKRARSQDSSVIDSNAATMYIWCVKTGASPSQATNAEGSQL